MKNIKILFAMMFLGIFFASYTVRMYAPGGMEDSDEEGEFQDASDGGDGGKSEELMDPVKRGGSLRRTESESDLRSSILDPETKRKNKKLEQENKNLNEELKSQQKRQKLANGNLKFDEAYKFLKSLGIFPDGTPEGGKDHFNQQFTTKGLVESFEDKMNTGKGEAEALAIGATIALLRMSGETGRNTVEKMLREMSQTGLEKCIKLGIELSGAGTAAFWDQPFDFIANLMQYRSEDSDSDVGYWEKLRTDAKEAYNDCYNYSNQYHWYKSPYGRALRAGIACGIMWFFMNQLPNPMRSDRWTRQQSFVVPTSLSAGGDGKREEV